MSKKTMYIYNGEDPLVLNSKETIYPGAVVSVQTHDRQKGVTVLSVHGNPGGREDEIGSVPSVEFAYSFSKVR